MRTEQKRLDLIAINRDGEPVLLVEIKSAPIREESVQWLLSAMEESPATVKFGMMVGPKVIHVYARGESSPIAEFDAIEVLQHYSPDYSGEPTPHGHRRFLELMIQTLLGAWLRDLAYRWKPGSPPKLDEIDRLGLLDLLKDGTTDEEVTVDGHSLC